MSKNKKTIIVLLLLAVVLAAVLAGIWQYRKISRTLSTEDYIAIAEKLILEGELGSAYGHYQVAAKKTNSIEAHTQCAFLASKINKHKEVIFHCNQVLNSNHQNLELYQILFEAEQESGSFDLNKAQKRLLELPESFERDDVRAKLYFAHNKPKEALFIWNRLFEKNNSSNIAEKILYAYLQKNDFQNVISFGEKCKEISALNDTGHLLIFYALLSNGQFQEANLWLTQAIQKQPTSEALLFEMAKLNFVQGNFTKSINDFKTVNDGAFLYPNNINNASFFLNSLKSNSSPELQLISSKFSPAFKKRLTDFRVHHILKEDLLNDLIKELNQIIRGDSLETQIPRLENNHHSEFDSSKMINRRWLSAAFPSYIQKQNLHPSRHEARLYLSILYQLTNKQDLIKNLQVTDNDIDVAIETENLLIESIQNVNPEKGLEAIEKALHLKSLESVLLLQKGRLLFLNKKFKLAANAFRMVVESNNLFLFSHFFVCEWARALYLDNKPEEALQLLGELHLRGIISPTSLTMSRDLALQLDNAELAQKSQEYLIKHFPELQNEVWGQAVLLMSHGKLEEAKIKFQKLEQQNPENTRYSIAKIATEFYQGNYEQTIQACESSTIKPELLVTLKSKSYQLLGKPREALECYHDIPHQQLKAQQKIHLAELLNINQNHEKAIELYHALIQNDPNNHQAYIGLISTHINNEKVETASTLLQQYEEKELPQNADYYYLMARKELLKNNHSGALGYSQQALFLDPTYTPALFTTGICFYELGDYKKAIKSLLESEPSFQKNLQHQFYLLQTTFYMGQYNDCLQRVEKLLKRKPNDSGLLETKIKCLLQLGHTDAASVFLTQKERTLEKDVFANLKAEILIIQSMPEKAATLLEKNSKYPSCLHHWIKLQLEHDFKKSWLDELVPDALPWQDWADLGRLAESFNKFKEASKLYEHALKEQPDNPGLLNNFTWSRLKAGNADDSTLKAIERAKELAPKNIDILDTYVELLISREQFDKSLSTLQQNINLVNGDSKLLYLLALSYEKNFMLGEALKSYQTCLSFETSKKKWELPVTKQELEQAIKRLNEI